MRNLLLSLLLMLPFSVHAAQPLNLDCLKRQIISYYDSGDYEKEVNGVVRNAEEYMQKRLGENRSLSAPQRFALVLDIDDTSISHYKLNRKNDFSLTQLIRVINSETKTPVVKPVLRLYNEAVARGVAVFFISSRPDEMRSNIITNLQNAGYAGWTNIYLPVGEEGDMSGQEFKSLKRRQIEAQGYTIIMNVGDQESDLAGGYAEKTFKLPNPMYTSTPADCPKC